MRGANASTRTLGAAMSTPDAMPTARTAEGPRATEYAPLPPLPLREGIGDGQILGRGHAIEPPVPASPAAATATTLCAFSIDVEEYFHAEAFAGALTPQRRVELPSRAAAPLECLLTLLSETGSRATLFVLGQCARPLARLLREAAAAGHEIACHGHAHAHLARLDPQSFREDLRIARRTIEEHVGVSPRGYRAPTFSLTRKTAWALDVLIDEGFTYDASIFPVRHDRYGVPDAPHVPFLAVAPSGRSMVEFPPLTIGLRRLRLPVGGGGYLRLLPGWVVRAAVRRAARRGRPALIYVHPWELDPGQPRLPAGVLATWRHRVGLRSTHAKLRRLLAGQRFDSISRVLARITRRPGLTRFAL